MSYVIKNSDAAQMLSTDCQLIPVTTGEVTVSA